MANQDGLVGIDGSGAAPIKHSLAVVPAVNQVVIDPQIQAPSPLK
ncbi:hypothetical protein VAE151_190002 [Vibrio aestuarianus]|nr:hypothetical protein VAE151_190002 [Vibrio aestuarianus]